MSRSSRSAPWSRCCSRPRESGGGRDRRRGVRRALRAPDRRRRDGAQPAHAGAHGRPTGNRGRTPGHRLLETLGAGRPVRVDRWSICPDDAGEAAHAIRAARMNQWIFYMAESLRMRYRGSRYPSGTPRPSGSFTYRIGWHNPAHDGPSRLRRVARPPAPGLAVPIYRDDLRRLRHAGLGLRKIDDGRSSFLLESVEGGETWGRYSFLGSRPAAVFRAHRRQAARSSSDGKTETLEGTDPFAVLGPTARRAPRGRRARPAPFRRRGGRVLRLRRRAPPREAAVHAHRRPRRARRRVPLHRRAGHLRQPPAHDEGRRPRPPRQGPARGLRRRAGADRRRDRTPRRPGNGPRARGGNGRRRRARTARAAEHDGTASASRPPSSGRKEYILAGDVFQVVLSHRLSAAASTLAVRRLPRAAGGEPVAVHVLPRLGEARWSALARGAGAPRRASASRCGRSPAPARAGASADEDGASSDELLADAKERAEHVMLVDLGRNDVGRVAELGTSRSTELMTVERYSHVMHLVSHVRGALAPGTTRSTSLRACFPAGTVSRRAQDPRDGDHRRARAAPPRPLRRRGRLLRPPRQPGPRIAIRTLVYERRRAYVQAGAGIVADSDPGARVRGDAATRAAALLRALELARDRSWRRA